MPQGRVHEIGFGDSEGQRVLMWYLIALIWLALVAGIFWIYRRRRMRAVSERTREISVLLAEAKKSVGKPAEAALASMPAAANPAAVQGETGFARKPRLLAKTDAWLYFLFRAALPDHEIFANVALCDVVEPVTSLRGYDREQVLRRLAPTMLNVVVCNKQLEIVAAVFFSQTDTASLAAQKFGESCLRAAGIRVINIDPVALPRPQQVRALVCGDILPAQS